MCLQKMEDMVSSKSVSLKLISALKKQSDFYSKQNLRELTSEEYEQYQRMRNACVHYIRVPHVYFGTRRDVFAAAVSLLDVFLWKVKVTIKHMTIVSAACFLIACKMLEEEEVQPSTKQLASLPSHEWTANDLCRMELHILKKLNWNVSTVSYVEFLPLFAELSGENVATVCADAVISLAERCLTQQSTVIVKPLVLAFCLFNHATNTCHLLWNQIPHDDLDQLKTLSEVDECQKNLLHQLYQIMSLPSQVPCKSAVFPVKSFKKPNHPKAFDSIKHEAVFEALRRHGVGKRHINILKETYREGTSQIRTETLSRKISIMKGVRQGDTLSPIMFTAALEEIFKRVNIEAGININGEKLNNLRFADDIILFAETEEELENFDVY